MKTKRLIELLQLADPTGEKEACFQNNEDIVNIQEVPASLFGYQQILDRKDGEITEAHVVGNGEKILIQTLSIEKAVRDNPELIVHVKTGNVTENEKYRMLIQSWITDVKKQNKSDQKYQKKHNMAERLF